jgi:quercetin dioxygenase-like cupin family protein
VVAVVLGVLGGTTWMSGGFWAPDGAFSRLVSPILLLAWVVVVSRVLLTRPAARAGWWGSKDKEPATAAADIRRRTGSLSNHRSGASDNGHVDTVYEHPGELYMKKTLATMGVAMLIFGSALVPEVVQAQQPGSRRTDLQRHDISAPGREVIQVRVDFDPGYVAPKHTHPGEEIIYVIEGTLEYYVEGRPPTTYKAGDVLIVPYGIVHSVKNVGNSNGAELATYIVEKGKPLITLVQDQKSPTRWAPNARLDQSG